jgi:hypothetical protein
LTNINLPQTTKDVLRIYKIQIDIVLDYPIDYKGVFILTKKSRSLCMGLFWKFIGLKILGSSKNPQLLGLNVIDDDNKIYIVKIDGGRQFQFIKINYLI